MMQTKLTNNKYKLVSNKVSVWIWTKFLVLLLLALYFIIISIVQPKGLIKWTWHYGIWFTIASYVVFWEGRRYFKLYKKLWQGIVDMDTLIGLAVHIIYLYSLVMMFMNLTSPIYSYFAMWESPIVLVMVTNFGHAVEEKLSKSTLETYEKLKKLKNANANLLVGNQVKIVQAKDLKLGSIILVRKGEVVPLDGKIISLDKGKFSYANITGESQKITLSQNQEVISGAFNLGDVVKLKITKTHAHSTIGIIVDKIEDASMTKPKVQRVVDNILRWFVPGVLLIAILTFYVWLVLGYALPSGIDLPWMIKNNSSIINNAILAGVTVLAIACPCALGIATPLITAITSTTAMQGGLLINDVNALEGIDKIKYFAFDKTGTITTEQLVVVKVHGNKKLLGVAKALESKVKHPIAQSILSIPGKKLRVLQVKTSNKSVSGKYRGQKVSMGPFFSNDPKFNYNNTLVALYVANKVQLIFELQNQVRANVLSTINKIKSFGYTPVMVTGDSEHIAKHIAQQVGINKIYFQTSPLEKSVIIQDLQKKGGVAFVGDGFNDALAIKHAQLSLAFATGSDITNSLANISIINNKFESIFNLVKISKMNKNRIRVSMTWALLFNIITIPIAMILLVPLWAGATIMASSNVLIMLNALLYKIKGTKLVTKS